MSEAQKAAEVLEQIESDARLAAIVNSSDDAIVSKSLDGTILTWNKGAEEIFGYTEAEAIGRSIRILFPDDRQQEEDEILRRISSGERIEHFETVRCRKDGSLVNVSVSISPIRDANGDVIGASKVARNIDDRIAAEVSQAHLAAIVESSHDAIVSKSLDGIIQSWNRGAEQIFGYSSAEAVGKPIAIVIPDDRLHEETEILQRLRRGERVEHFETVRRRKDGTLLDISVTISPIRNAAGKIIGASKVARDVTKQKETERLLQTLNEELERRVAERTAALQATNQELEGFTYSVSHDLRGPLRGLIASSMILLEDYGGHLSEEAKELIYRQVHAANRLAQLVDDLLKLSRIGRASFHKVRADLTGITEDVVDELKESYPAASVSIQRDMRAHGDPELLRLLMLNLIGNACKFSKDAPCIHVGKDGDWFYVRDQGIGFDMKYEHKLFIPFERLVRDDEFPGTGIGLANVKRIVDRHGGELKVESKLGEGSTFYFSLPA